MSELLLQVLILVAFGTFCFGCGYLTASIVTPTSGGTKMIKPVLPATTGKWEWGEPPKESRM
jgi:hypothetical protein